MEPTPDQQKKPPLVLLVDDHDAIRQIVRWSLHFDGIQPIEAANGREAVIWMEQAAREMRFPSVILLDLAMPGMDGHAFLSWLESSWIGRYPTPHVIILTAESFLQHALPFPPCVKHIVSKPFQVRELVDLIRKWSG
jgi:CheY-like chemotaxis protein